MAKATEEHIYPLWAGLGYYQRAKNLIKASKEIEKLNRFPSSYRELLQLPGFGPYTARAVSSLTFEEPVGIVDGNVIRFLSRFHGLHIKWWTTQGRKYLQDLADQWVDNQKPSQINQALMEIGSLICSSPRPSCLLCPLRNHCKAFKNQNQNLLPLKRPKKAEEIFHWKPIVIEKEGLFAFVQNKTLPFLKGRLVLPGKFRKISSPPLHSHFKHSITHHKIYVTVRFTKSKGNFKSSLKRKDALLALQTKQEQITWLDCEAIKKKKPVLSYTKNS